MPNADLSRGGVFQLHSKGDSTVKAVRNVIEERKAAPPGKNRHVAFEAVLTLSPEAFSFVKHDEFFRRASEAVENIFGPENVAEQWAHRDEKSPHLHAIVVPIVRGIPPGRPGKNKLSNVRNYVSWNRFSGSHLRKANGGRNPTMAGWQDDWTEAWTDYGFHRGISSNRDHLPTQWVQGETADIWARADGILEKLQAQNSSLQLPKNIDTIDPRSAFFCGSHEQFSAMIGSVRQATADMRELGCRGVQLEAERRSRVDLAERLKATELERDTAVRELAELKSRKVITIEMDVADAPRICGLDKFTEEELRGIEEAAKFHADFIVPRSPPLAPPASQTLSQITGFRLGEGRSQ